VSSGGELPVPGPDALGDLIGIEHLEGEEGVARARIPVSDRIMQPYGIVHGGTIATLTETVASKATAETVAADGKLAMGQSNHTTFLRPISAGHLNAEARARHRGRSTWVWDVEVSDDEGRLCALARVVVAVREPRG
jgi:1,4-dihydroxy-2-naphthoyl-CoA hydrolase